MVKCTKLKDTWWVVTNAQLHLAYTPIKIENISPHAHTQNIPAPVPFWKQSLLYFFPLLISLAVVELDINRIT
jgi:hypothetical protein